MNPNGFSYQLFYLICIGHVPIRMCWNFAYHLLRHLAPRLPNNYLMKNNLIIDGTKGIGVAVIDLRVV